jgi:hypothetical protein
MDEVWGPAHEIGHLLVAHPKHIGQPDFGLKKHYSSKDFKPKLYEVAASLVHSWILVECGEEGQAAYEATWNDWIPDFMMNSRWEHFEPTALALIATRGCTRDVVRTPAGLAQLCVAATQRATQYVAMLRSKRC